MQRVHMRVQGRVQGVYFRAATRRTARQLGLTGWVRNCPDGSVEAWAEGEKILLERLLSWCRSGPSGALVTDIKVAWQEATGEFVDFVVSY